MTQNNYFNSACLNIWFASIPAELWYCFISTDSLWRFPFQSLNLGFLIEKGKWGISFIFYFIYQDANRLNANFWPILTQCATAKIVDWNIWVTFLFSFVFCWLCCTLTSGTWTLFHNGIKITFTLLNLHIVLVYREVFSSRNRILMLSWL